MNASLRPCATQADPAWGNPMGNDGFEFIETAAPDPVAMEQLFERMGFKRVAKHRPKDVTLYRQGEINFIGNTEPDSFPSASRGCTAPVCVPSRFACKTQRPLTNAPSRWAPGAQRTTPARAS